MGKKKLEPIRHEHVAFEAEYAIEDLFYGWDKPVRIYVNDGRTASGVWFSIEDAEHYLQYNRKQLAARSQGARFKYVSDVERNFNTLTLHFPALTYSITVDD